MNENKKLSTESYKGVRDFYPEDSFTLEYIFTIWKRTVESFGYVEYQGSILEPAELYKAKTGEEIVNEQTYTFTDRGGRDVTLRPEMTPTVARMIAGREKELSFPLRWYSIPNLFRYEKPQHGRLREHWQLNVDFFGVDSTEADCEIITLAHRIMASFGAKDSDFIIKINNRKIMQELYDKFSLDEETSYKVSKVIDKKDKISNITFEEMMAQLLGEKAEDFIALLESNEKLLNFFGAENGPVKELIGLIDKLQANEVKNIIFDSTLMRGFDYYTGIIFEVYDSNPENPRSIFGGGRYDDILDIFGKRKIPAVGFGAGDLTTHDFLETHGLIPIYRNAVDLYICTLSNEYLNEANILANKLRKLGVNVSLDLSGKKVSDQLKTAHKQKFPYTLVIGEDEVKSGVYPLKNMDSGEDKKVRVEEIPNLVKNR